MADLKEIIRLKLCYLELSKLIKFNSVESNINSEKKIRLKFTIRSYTKR